MTIIAHIFRSFAFLGILSWMVAWLVSAILNFRFGFLVSGGGGAALLFALLLFCLDVAKGALQLTILQEMRQGRHPSFLYGFLYCAAALSFYIAVSNIMATRVQGSDLNEAALTASSEVQGTIDRLKQERESLGNPRTKAQIEIEQERLQRSPHWTRSNGCTETEHRKLLAFCEQYLELRKEIVQRERLESITQELGSLTGAQEEKGVVSDHDPLTTMLAGLLRFSGTTDISLQKKMLYIVIAVLIACLVEIWSSFGLLWMGRAFGYDLLAYGVPQTIEAKPIPPKLIESAPLQITKTEARKAITASNSSDADALLDAFFKDETVSVDISALKSDETSMDVAMPFCDIFEAYSDYCRAHGAEPIGPSAFSERSKERGYFKGHKQGGVAYCIGIKLKRK